MMQGFVLTHQAGLDLATRPVRLSAAGMRDIRRQATRHGQLESITVAAMAATTSANVWLCGQITNEHAIRRLLAERGHVDDGLSGWLHHLYREYGYHGFALLEKPFVKQIFAKLTIKSNIVLIPSGIWIGPVAMPSSWSHNQD